MPNFLRRSQLQKTIPKAETMARLLLYGFIAAFALFFLLVVMASRVEWLAAYYPWVFWLNVLVISVLGIATASRMVRLWQSIHNQQYGSRLARKLFTILALVSIVPSMVVYGLSYRFLDTAIESWFKLEIDKTVTEGIDLARWVREEESKRLLQAADNLARELSPLSPTERRLQIAKWRDLLGVQEISLFDETLKSWGQSQNNQYALTASFPDTLSIKDINYRAIARFENTAEVNDPENYLPPQIRVLVKVPARSLSEPFVTNQDSDFSLIASAPSTGSKPLDYADTLYLQIVKIMPERINQSARKLAVAYKRYGELEQGRDGLKKLFLTALTILFVLTLITALSLAFHYSNRFVQPLAALGEGTRAVARGDFTKPLSEGEPSHDEFDQLIISFNDMLIDLKQAQDNALKAQVEMAESRAFLDNVLNHLNAGVMIVELKGESLQLILVNPAAHRLLGIDLTSLHGLDIKEWEKLLPPMRPLSQLIISKLSQNSIMQKTTNNKTVEWSKQLEMRLPMGFRSIMVRGASLPDNERWVVVFDDISELLQAQQMHIWSEMARRLAHEIKNPLTPIQLSAERMMMKISDKLPEEVDRLFLERSVDTIVSQVDAIKTLVNQFREMARPASTQLEVFLVNDLLQEIVALYDEKRVSLANTHKNIKVFADRHQLRQILHNLILNAEQANMELLGEWSKSRVQLTLHEGFVDNYVQRHLSNEQVGASSDTGKQIIGIWIIVLDIGGGFSQEIMDRAFEPNVTSKIKGSGLGLSIVRKIVEEHRGSIFVQNEQWLGGDTSYAWDNITPVGKLAKGAKIMLWLPQNKDTKEL